MDPPEERVLRLVANPENRAVLTVLNDAAKPVTLSELVDRLATQTPDLIADISNEAARKQLQLSLHHHNLPKLDEAGLVTYDRSQNVVSDERYPSVDAELVELELIDELRSYFSAGTDVSADAIGVVEGQDDVIEYARDLTDEADDELFYIYVSEVLLQNECVRRVDAALERDVDVALGSKNPEVRERVRTELPGTTIWEPQLDWLSSPAQYPKIGRLVFADREKIMLAILDESEVDGTTTETAIVGEGQSNPLVVLVRQLLGPRLDHLDYQSDEFLDDLPFEP
ncbi:ArsR family transcriptional regulator [Salinadaptatus halalkaliphilus]|uniref:ArsR family transcriptional regulator n=1 Tax=Salinadaptatus halalkaliphilus TaxID=2419781 RepID=A0A4V3VKW4_9EURY|nr:ArsR family transcriptional regulator [Salinadaptatus halalkaliphilus]THE63317.1 ArsR family transcriptional regulator [Salinadaptatus halalkaliphilus]